ncbi:MAG: hypothetical protein EBX41_07435 [Chitinophagia bacterium]|nr:hypothetical protein [Chitinophagia bacterium]
MEDEKMQELRELGKKEAEAATCNPKMLPTSLDTVYHVLLKEAHMNEEQRAKIIVSLENEIQELTAKVNKQTGEVKSLITSKQSAEEAVLRIEKERNGLGTQKIPFTELLPLYIAAFIVIALSAYLFFFYSASGFSAIYGITNGQIFDVNVFNSAWHKGFGILLLTLLFPIIFLALGFLINDSLEKKKYPAVVSVLLITLILDAIIGYKISYGMHNYSYNKGLIDEKWEFGLIWKDVNFYLILLLGFVVYVIWGALLNYTFTKHKEIQPDTQLSVKQKEKDLELEKFRKDSKDLGEKIFHLEEDIKTTEELKQKRIKKKSDYEIKIITSIDTDTLKSYLAYFMQGWKSYLRTAGEEAEKEKETWLNNKIEALNANID